MAIDIADHLEKVKDHLQTRFWLCYRDEMHRRLAAAGLTERWEVRLVPENKLMKG